MRMVSKQDLKHILGQIPLTAEAYWYLRQPGKPITPEFTLDQLEQYIPIWCEQIAAAQSDPAVVSMKSRSKQKRVFVFGTLRYWVEHACLLSMALAGFGHSVTFSYLPYARWQTPIDSFNLRRQNLYAEGVLGKALPLVKIVPLLNHGNARRIPTELMHSVELVSLRDTQYTLQLEEVSQSSDLYKLRLQRNQAAACAAFFYLRRHDPDIIILPNGTILEFGMLYQVARYLDIPVVTYEFGEQRERIWLAQNAEVMRQKTDDLWQAHKSQKLTQEQQSQVRKLFASRQRASLWENFSRRWQGVPSEGGEQVRQTLGLDQRPIVLLATNVIGDSLTLGRQIFSDSMTEWLERTMQYFASHPEVQLVIRIHPGELITKGPSVADIVIKTLPSIPENIHLVPADGKVNTYDIVDLADLGLVYTTTVGMEMAMSGVPVIVVGNTHYRNKGFTLEPQSWQGYFELLTNVLINPGQYRLSQEQVEQAWNYAYRFFFDYPHPFPWHLLHMWKDLETWPLSRLFTEAGLSTYSKTFSYLVGEPVIW
jgi:hypothetical protein